jgi:hypothetical protein
MNDDRYKGLSDTERDAMRSMASGAVPREGLEDDTVRFLASHGMIGSRKRGILMKVSATVGALVAVALIFVAGVTVGKRGGEETATVTPQSEKQYVLLLYMTAGERETRPAPDEPYSEAMLAIIEEYRQWGVRLADQGRLVGAEKLKSDAFVLAGEKAMKLEHPTAGARVLGGYFLIRASGMEHARELASTHPHLKYGGEIEIRPLDLHD